MDNSRSRKLFIFVAPVLILIEIALFFFTIFINLNNISGYLRAFIYLFPFIIFYDGLYFYDKELVYAQIVKLITLALIRNRINCNVLIVFSLLIWVYSMIQYYCKIECGDIWRINHRRKHKCVYITIVNFIVLGLLIYLFREFFQCVLIYLREFFQCADDKRITDISSWVITFISTDLIFNFTAMFILLQENFNKYNSVFLLQNILGFKTIILVSVIPGGMIVLLCLKVIPPGYFLLFPIFCILYCLICSVYLLSRLKYILSDTNLLSLFMSKTTENMFHWYKTDKLSASENYIDTILRITANSISKKYLDTLPDIFAYVLGWLTENKELIAEKRYSPYNNSNNKFYYFMDVLTDSLISANSQVMVKLYAKQLFYVFQNEIGNKPFKNRQIDFRKQLVDLHLFYYSLYKLMLYYVSLNNKDFDEIILRLSGVYEYNIQNNFLQFKPSEREGLHIFESEDYRYFECCFFEFYEKVIDEAIKVGNFRYLKHLRLFSKFYGLNDGKLNNNYLMLLHKFTNIYLRILEACKYENEVLFSVFLDYKMLLHYFSYLGMDITLSELIGNVVYNSIKDIYVKLLQNKVCFTERHLELLYGLYFKQRKKLNKADSYLNLFCFVVASYLSYADIEKEQFSINKIWSRVEQLEALFSERKQFGLLQILENKKDEMLRKHPEVQINYENYRSILEKKLTAYEEAIKKFEEII